MPYEIPWQCTPCNSGFGIGGALATGQVQKRQAAADRMERFADELFVLDGAMPQATRYQRGSRGGDDPD